MYFNIINPINKTKLNIFSYSSKQLLKKYIQQFLGGSSSISPKTTTNKSYSKSYSKVSSKVSSNGSSINSENKKPIHFQNLFKSVDEEVNDKRDLLKAFSKIKVIQHFYSNEKKIKKTLTKLKKDTKVYGNTVLAVGCFMPLNIFSNRPDSVTHLIIVDLSGEIGRLYKRLSVIITNSLNKEEALEKCIVDFKSRYENNKTIINITNLKENISFLNNDVEFERVKLLFKRKNYIFLNQDILNKKFLDILFKILKDNQLYIDTMYFSNVPNTSYFGRINDYVLMNLIKKRVIEYLEQTDFIYIYVSGKGFNSNQSYNLINQYKDMFYYK